MKIYVVYFRTMQDSPDVRVVSVTSNAKVAKRVFNDAKAQAEDWMADEDDDSGNWAEARMETFDGIRDIAVGSLLFVGIFTNWTESVETEIHLGGSESSIRSWISLRKRDLLREDPNIEPFDEDEAIEESMHLCNPDVMSDYYFSVEPVTVE